MEPTNKIAKKYPDVKFEHATGYKRESENVSTYGAKFYQGRYVQGQIAASESKSGVAGVILLHSQFLRLFAESTHSSLALNL